MARKGNAVDDIYFHWLMEKIHCESSDIDLMREIHGIRFEYKIPKDKNRESDGLRLRKEFEELSGYHVSSKRFCSVLEMLIALAARIDEEYIGEMDNPHPEDLFWDMIDNLGLRRDFQISDEMVFDTLEEWMDREFRWNGDGSPFPIENPQENQRNLEIWDQAMRYINENY